MITLEEVLYALGIFIWIIIVVSVISKAVYEIGKKRYKNDYVGIYFARKVIHMLAGGLAAILVAMGLFKTPMMPLIMAMVLAFICYWPHHKNKLMYWFQDPNNTYEVNFCFAWSILITLGWLFANGEHWWFGVVPILFMAFGDGITGIVRNVVFKRRTKHWIGNLAMFAFCAPMGYFLGSFHEIGVLAAFAGSFIEHFEKIGKYYIDDNVTVPSISFAILVFFTMFKVF
ncbi:MAG: dolichol kinase [Candidatus Bathyarchaeia archaeon]